MKNVWINNIGPRFIEVGWKLDCSDRAGMVTGFLISYCPIFGPQHIVCREPKQNVTVMGDPSTIRGTIWDLRPYTTYMVSVAVLTKSGAGQFSLELLNTTLEAAPDSPPRNVTFSLVTNTSMLISWRPPAVSNGLLRYYQVRLNTAY
jgi:cytokine receptor domeless